MIVLTRKLLCLVNAMPGPEQRDGYDAGVVKSTQVYWEQRTGGPVTAEDARECIRSVGELFALLARWDTQEQQALTDTHGTQAPDDGTPEGITP